MRALIIEDEKLAGDRLKKLILELRKDAEILPRIDSIEDAVDFLERNKPDLIFLDIQLSDGICFEIFNRVKVNIPIVFTTAYDEYAIKAFKLNSVDYLLKPLDKGELEVALNKYENSSMEKKSKSASFDQSMMQELLQKLTNKYKERFVIKVGEHIKTVATENVYYFISQQKMTYLVDDQGKKYIIDFTLDKVEDLLDPKYFYRINRKMIIHDQSVEDIVSFSNSRLKLFISHSDNQDSIVARERVAHFKEWLDR